VAAVVPYSLDLLLLDGALAGLDHARDCMESGAYMEKQRAMCATLAIVAELRSTLDVGRGGPLAVNMDDVCAYMSRQLASAEVHDQAATLDEVSHLLREVRIAWAMLPPDARTARGDMLEEE
jgi:flagellar secretion chaperone FliS